MSRRIQFRLWIALIVLLVSCCLLTWSFWPTNRVRNELPLPTLQFLTATPAGLVWASMTRISRRRMKAMWITAALVGTAGIAAACAAAAATPVYQPAVKPTAASGAVESTQAAVPTDVPWRAPQQEPRLVSIEWPERIRVGESDVIRLTLEVDESGRITPTAEVGGHEISGQVVEIPYVYDLYQVVAETRLDLAGMQVYPQNEVSEPLAPGKTATFYWSISATQAGTYRGTLWLYLNLIPRAGGPSDRQTLLAKRLDIDATTFLGMSAGTARVAGAVGSVASLIMGFPFFERVLEAIWKKFRR